jgi:hypothetical protein
MNAIALFFLTQYSSMHDRHFYTCPTERLLIFNTLSTFSEFFFSKFSNGKELDDKRIILQWISTGSCENVESSGSG